MLFEDTIFVLPNNEIKINNIMASLKSINNRKFKTATIPEVFELGKKGFHAGLKAPVQCKEVMRLLETGNSIDILGSWNKGWHSEQMRKANESLVGFFS